MLLGGRIGSWFKRSSPEPTPTGRTVAKYLQYIDLMQTDIEIGSVISTGFVMDTATKGFKFCFKNAELSCDNISIIACNSVDDESGMRVNVAMLGTKYCIYLEDNGASKLFNVSSPYIEIENNYLNSGLMKSGSQSYPVRSMAQSDLEFVLGGYADIEGDQYYENVRIAEFIGTDGDEVVCHLVPVEDNNGVACLYDTINGVFRDAVGSVPAVAGPVLPYDSLVDYIASDGTAYIKTNVPTTGEGNTIPYNELDLTWIVDYYVHEPKAFSSENVLTGWMTSVRLRSTPVVNSSSTKYGFLSGYQTSQVYLSEVDNDGQTFHLCKFDIKSGCFNAYVDNNLFFTRTYTSTTVFKHNYFALFCLTYLSSTYDGVRYGSSGYRVRRFCCLNGNLNNSFDGIACVKDNVAYFYDRVTGNLFGNSAGAGALLYGDRID